MRIDSVSRQANELNPALGEFGLEFSKGSQLGCADWCVVLRVREEDNPAVANELVKIDGTVGCVCFEIWRGRPKTKADFLCV